MVPASGLLLLLLLWVAHPLRWCAAGGDGGHVVAGGREGSACQERCHGEWRCRGCISRVLLCARGLLPPQPHAELSWAPRCDARRPRIGGGGISFFAASRATPPVRAR